MHKVVLDTNIWVSGILLGGNSADVLQGIQRKNWQIYVSPKIVEEINRVLGYEKINKILRKVGKTRLDVLNQILSMCILIRPKVQVNAITKDKSDNMFLECARECDALCIVSGDKHLLVLKDFEGTEILSPVEFLKKVL